MGATGFPVAVVSGDGTHGHPAGAPYDRVIATASVRVGELPSEWIAQTRPGGVIVTPMRTDFGGSVALVRFAVDENGTATGRPIDRLGFMAVRSHRTPPWSRDHLDPDDPAAEDSTTSLKPPARSASMDPAGCGTRSRRPSAHGQPTGNQPWTERESSLRSA